jgi:hypothetical protein
MKLTAIATAALLAGSALANTMALPRSFGVIRDAMTHSSAQKRQHDHDHFNVVFPQQCITQCQTMVRAATYVPRSTTSPHSLCPGSHPPSRLPPPRQMESAAYQARATQSVGTEIGPDLDSDLITAANRTALCTADNVAAILGCVNCAYGQGVPNLSRDDAEDVVEWFDDFCENVQVWEGTSTAITASQTVV